jgi:hypothetical protein
MNGPSFLVPKVVRCRTPTVALSRKDQDSVHVPTVLGLGSEIPRSTLWIAAPLGPEVEQDDLFRNAVTVEVNIDCHGLQTSLHDAVIQIAIAIHAGFADHPIDLVRLGLFGPTCDMNPKGKRQTRSASDGQPDKALPPQLNAAA